MSSIDIGMWQAEQYAPVMAAQATSSMADMWFGMALGGAAQSAIGAYFAAESQKYMAKSQALDMQFAKSMADINARAAESEANAIEEAGRRDAGNIAAQYGQAKQSFIAQQGASGVTMEGSNAEVAASLELAKEQDVLTTTANATRAAASRRAEGVDYQNRGRMAGVSAENLRGTASSIRPAAQAGATLLGSASQVAPHWLYRNRRSRY